MNSGWTTICNSLFSCDVIIFQNLSLPFLLRFKFHQIKDPIGTWHLTMFSFHRVLLLVIEHVWISKLLRCVTWKWRPKKAVAKAKRWVIALGFADQTVTAREEAFISMCWVSRAIIFRFNSKTQCRCFCYFMAAMFVSLQRTQTWCLHTKLYEFGWHTSANNLQVKNSRGLILGEVVYISVIYCIPDSWLYSWNGYDF